MVNSLDKMDKAIIAKAAYEKPLSSSILSNKNEDSDSGSSSGSSAFSNILKNMAAQPYDALKQAEKVTFKALNGKEDLTTVVSSINKASLAVKEITMLRNRIISAYQDIMRMQI